MKKVFKLNELQTAYMRKLLESGTPERHKTFYPDNGSLLLANIEIARSKSNLSLFSNVLSGPELHADMAMEMPVNKDISSSDHQSDELSTYSKKRALDQDEPDGSRAAKSRHPERTHAHDVQISLENRARIDVEVGGPKKMCPEHQRIYDESSNFDRNNLPRTPSCVVEEWNHGNTHGCQIHTSEQISSASGGTFNLTIDL
mmetsp:Transcript_6491/g.14840  ORF Transcript_6491/g.14840 Transcript_6491/m.14840 type:complete len:201 (-) Transcript_6491:64-666(-)